MFRSIRSINLLRSIIVIESKSIRPLSTLNCGQFLISRPTQLLIPKNDFQPILVSSYSAGTSKKAKKNKPAVEHIGRLDLRIGKIVKVDKAPDADTLYLTKVDCGEESERSIVAGLAKFLPVDALQDKLVVVICNLKPAKLRGYLSEGMILCATNGTATEPIDPPKDARVGDIVDCENYERAPVETPRDKKRLFDPIADDLSTNEESVVCYKGSYLYIAGKGNVTVKTLKNCSII